MNIATPAKAISLIRAMTHKLLYPTILHTIRQKLITIGIFIPSHSQPAYILHPPNSFNILYKRPKYNKNKT